MVTEIRIGLMALGLADCVSYCLKAVIVTKTDFLFTSSDLFKHSSDENIESGHQEEDILISN